MEKLENKNYSIKSIFEKQMKATKIINTILNQAGIHALLFSGSPASTVLLHLIRTVKGGEITLLVFHIELLKGFSKIYQYLGKIERLWNFKIIRKINEKLIDSIDIDSDWEELYDLHTKNTVYTLLRKYDVTYVFSANYGKSESKDMEGVCLEKDPNLKIVMPILHFSIEDIWETVQDNNLPYCSLFRNKFKKVHPDLVGIEPNSNILQRGGTDLEHLETAKKLKNLGYL